jgi:hypothetical protein
VGMCLALALAAPGVGGVFSGLGSGAGGAAAMTANRSDLRLRISPPTRPNEPGAVQRNDQGRPLTDEEKVLAKDAADKAAALATATAWVTLGALLISMAATMFAAGWNRQISPRVVTEIRPRPIPTL